jgi:putative DNA primase/helicase
MTNDTSNVFKLAALQDSDAELIEELAGLSALDYDRRRKEAAKELNVGVAALDKAVAKERKRLGLDEDQSSPPFPSVEPATHPVLAAGLFQRLAARLKQHVVFSEEAANAVALWVAFAWTHDAATHSPILLVTSAERDSGKTTLLGLVNFVAPRGLMLVDPSPAVLYRLIEKWKPTLVVDEADDQFKENPPLRAVINSGWTRGAGVPRCDPDTNEPEIFSTFGPKAIGMKGRSIPDTTFSRSIVIEMVRKRPGERTADFEHLDDAGLKDLRRELARWAADSVEALAGTRPTMPDGFQNRLAANWRPLLAVADHAGGDWPRLARAAAVALAPKDMSSIGTTLLGDFRSIFADEKAANEKDPPDRLPSSAIAEKLHGLEDRPWAEWGRNGKPISPNQIARLLRPFGVAPETIVVTGDRRLKGYLLARFQEAFERYLDALPVSEPFNRYFATAAGTSTTSQTVTEGVQVTVQKCEKPLGHSGSNGWTDQKGGNGQEREENRQTGGPDPDDWTFNSDEAPGARQ